jgi:uncharacterized repeat protein (TIGR01451 family)
MRTWPRVLAPLALLLSVVVVGAGGAQTAGANIVPVPSGGSEVHAVIQVATSPSYAGDPIHIDSSQLQASCGGLIVFETLQGGSTQSPERSANSITVVLDDDGDATVVVDGAPCAPGTSVIEADLTVAPFLTALTTLVVLPPTVTPEGVSADPSAEVETGDTAASGDSDIYTVFTVETSPVYAEQPVEITSPQLEARCITGWRIEPGSGGTQIDQASGTSVAQGILDDDGNATFVFKGSSCATGPSAVIADVEAGTHPTYVTTFTVEPPVATVASLRMSATKARAHKHPKHPKRHHRAGGGGSGSGSGTGAPAGSSMTVSASPNPLILTGVPDQGKSAPVKETLNITKSDNAGGNSAAGTTGTLSSCVEEITYTITVTNSGPDELSGVVVNDDFTDNGDFTGDSYTDHDNGGATGSTSGTGNIADIVDLPAGSSIVYTVTAQISSETPTLVNTATATPSPENAYTSSSNFSAEDFDNVDDCS